MRFQHRGKGGALATQRSRPSFILVFIFVFIFLPLSLAFRPTTVRSGSPSSGRVPPGLSRLKLFSPCSVLLRDGSRMIELAR